MDSALLMTRQDELKIFLVMQKVEDMQHNASGIPEHVLHAFPFKGFQKISEPDIFIVPTLPRSDATYRPIKKFRILYHRNPCFLQENRDSLHDGPSAAELTSFA